jgi:hypothetical protein
MTTLGNENPRDCETVKRRAQAMKARLKELGHDIPFPDVDFDLARRNASQSVNVVVDQQPLGLPRFSRRATCSIAKEIASLSSR